MAGIERQELVGALDSLRRQRQGLINQIHAVEGGIQIVEKQLASLDANAKPDKKPGRK